MAPDLAAWMDEGMFARWILSELPGPDDSWLPSVPGSFRPRAAASPTPFTKLVNSRRQTPPSDQTDQGVERHRPPRSALEAKPLALAE